MDVEKCCRNSMQVEYLLVHCTRVTALDEVYSKTGSVEVVVCTEEEQRQKQSQTLRPLFLAQSWVIRREGALERIQIPAGCRA